MGADSTLVSASFREAETRAGTNVPNLKPLYESTVKQTRQSLGIITGVMDELKQDELNRIAGKDAQTQEFTGLVNKMDKMLAVDKVPLPQKVILAIEKGIKDLQLEFEDVNTYGDEDNRENERARTRINGELQKLISSAVNTRGGMMKIGKTIDNLNGIEFSDDNRAITSQMINLEDMDTDDRVSVGVANGQITFTASEWKTANIDGVEYTMTGEGAEDVSWNIDQIIEAIPMKDLNADIRMVAGLKDAKLGGAAAQAEGQVKESYNLEGAVRDIKTNIKTKEDFANIAQREIEGTDIQGFRTALLGSGELQLELIEAMFTNDLGEVNPIYDTFAALDTDGVNGITSADARGLTGEAYKIWKDNSTTLVDMITMTENKNFNLAVSTDIISNYLGDHQKQEFEKAWTAADKKENPNKYKQTDIRELTIQPGTYYRVGKGGKEMGSDILAAYTPYSKGEDFNSYTDEFSFSKKSGSWMVTGPSDPKKDGSFDGPITTRSQNEDELVALMGFDKQAQRLGFKGITVVAPDPKKEKERLERERLENENKTKLQGTEFDISMFSEEASDVLNTKLKSGLFKNINFTNVPGTFYGNKNKIEVFSGSNKITINFGLTDKTEQEKEMKKLNDFINKYNK